MPRDTRITFAHRVQYAAFLGVERLVRALPRSTAAAFGSAVGRLFYLVDARHRRLVRENLRGSSLRLDETGVRSLSKACFEHFGAMLFTTLRLLRNAPEKLDGLVRIEGREHIAAAYAERKGVIGLTGHFGNWELLALALGREGWFLDVIGRELDNPLLEKDLRSFRSSTGNSVIAKDGAVRGCLKSIKERRMVGFLLDQDALALGVFIRFLDRWASTFATPGMLATRFDLPILPLASRVEPDGTVVVTAFPPFHVPPSGDPARDTWTATQLMSAWIERQVLANPNQWFCWMHRRFKTQPGPGEPPLPAQEWMDALPASADPAP
jgi:KDO2-lipid IV(A) lauroyltransferase